MRAIFHSYYNFISSYNLLNLNIRTYISLNYLGVLIANLKLDSLSSQNCRIDLILFLTLVFIICVTPKITYFDPFLFHIY